MNETQLNNTFIMIFCLLINAIILFFVLINKNYNDKRGRIYIGVLSVNFLLLTSFMIRQLMENQPYPGYNTPLILTASIYQATSQVLLLLHIRLTLQSILRNAAITRITKYTAYIAAAAVFINFILSVSNLFTNVYFYFDDINRIVLKDALIISDIATFIWAVLTLFILISNRKNLSKKEMGALLSYVILPTIALVFYLLTLNLHFIIYAVMLSIIIYYASIQSELTGQLKQQELELSESRIAIMTSQIQPHFIYNALAAIKALIRTSPDMAAETVQEFSKYLRNNIESLSNIKPVSFENELTHVETYLSIENKRFKDKLEISYDITERNFELPALTIQPIVENAVRHGITSKKTTGGSINIAVHKINGETIITITDDGVGFNTRQVQNEQDRVKVGLRNVKTRLAAMVGGTLDIQSEIDKGTTVTITIPEGKKEGNRFENNSSR